MCAWVVNGFSLAGAYLVNGNDFSNAGACPRGDLDVVSSTDIPDGLFADVWMIHIYNDEHVVVVYD